MRLKSEIWVKAYVRRCYGAGSPAMIVRRGNTEAGAIFIKVNLLDGQVLLFAPAPAGMAELDQDRFWTAPLGDGSIAEADADGYLARQERFDPDFWVIEVEDRDGRHFLDDALISV